MFPYTFSVFLAYESALDIRANYPLIEERQKIVQNDPFCAGYIFWPEASHTDTLLLSYFTENAWRKGGAGIESVLPVFCRDRYGEDAGRMQGLWERVSRLSTLLDWRDNYFQLTLQHSRYHNPKKRINIYNNPAPCQDTGELRPSHERACGCRRNRCQMTDFWIFIVSFFRRIGYNSRIFAN